MKNNPTVTMCRNPSIFAKSLLSSSHPQGKAIGVGIGCILGMFPLLFFKDEDEKKEGQTEVKEQTQSPPAPTESSKN